MTSQKLQQEFYQYKDYESLKAKMDNLTQENEHLRYMINEEKEENLKSRDLKFQAISKFTQNLNEQKRKVYESNRKNLTSYYEINKRFETYRNTLKELDDDKLKNDMTDLLAAFDMTMNEYEVSFNQIAEENENVLNKLQAELERIALTLKK